MSLEGIREDSFRGDLRGTLTIILLWMIWLTLVSNLPHPSWLNLSMFPLLLLYGALGWNWFTVILITLCLSWLYRVFSITPPGQLWLALMGTYLVLKGIMTQFEIRRSTQVFFALVFGSLVFDSLQLIFLSRTNEDFKFSWTLPAMVLANALVQGVLALSFSRPLIARVRPI